MRKFIIVLMFLSLMFVCMQGLSADEEWHDSAYAYRIKAQLTWDAISSTSITNQVVWLDLSDEDIYWDYNGDDDQNDLIIYGPSNNGGNYGSYIEYPYEVTYYNANSEDYMLFFKAPLIKASGGTSTSNYCEIYIYTDYNSTGNFENASAVYADHSPIAVWNFDQSDKLLDSSGNGHTLTDSYNAVFEKKDYLGETGESYFLDKIYGGKPNYRLTMSTITLTYPFTMIGNLVDYSGGGVIGSYSYNDIWTAVSGATSGTTLSTTANSATDRSKVEDLYVSSANNFYIVGINRRGTGHNVYGLKNTSDWIYRTTADGTLDNKFYITEIPYDDPSGYNVNDDYADFIWIFGENTSRDFLNALTYNLRSYDSYLYLDYFQPEITYPTDGSTVRDLTFDITWDEESNYSYWIQVATDSGFSNLVYNDSSVDEGNYTVTLSNEDTYYTRVKLYDEITSNWLIWSSTIEFDVAVYADIPVLISPTDEEEITDSLLVNFLWEYTSGYTYDIKVGTNPTLSTYNYSSTDIDENASFEVQNYETYYWTVRGKYSGLIDSNWSTIQEFTMDYFPTNMIYFSTPVNASTTNSLKQTIGWNTISTAQYNIKWSQDSEMETYSSNTYSDPYVVLYLNNGNWYFDGRSYVGGEYSDWASDWIGIYYFTVNNKPTFGLPYSEEYSPYVDFNWTLINQVTNYELEVYSDEALTTRVFFEEPSYNYDTLTMDSGDYWARVRGVDDYVNGSWSDTFAFTVEIEDIPFIYTMNSVNYYGGDTMLYEFSGLDANVTYTFKINKLNDNGTFNSNIATKTVVGDGEGEGSFDYTFSNSAHYPFEVRYDETNSQLFKHFVAVRPSDRFYQAADHKLIYSDTVLAVGAGDVVYNNKSGFLHTNTLPTQCLYEYGDYFLLHYNFEWQEGVKFKILIMDMETGALMATIHSDDLYAFNHELGYAERNFIVVPTDGSTPAIVDDYALLLSYEGDDWNSLELPKGAYAYILIEDSLDNPNLAFGESVILVGDSSTTEWTITPSAASIIEGQKITWTITCNTEGIWDSYKLMRFYDTASDQYYLGTAGSPYYQSYPASYADSFTLNYNTNPALGYSAGAIFGIKPSDVPIDAYQYEYMTFDLASTYGYIVTQGYTITEATDLTDDLDSWLVTLGLGTATTKLMLSMALIILLVVVCAVLHVPVAGISIISLAAFIAMVAIGFIPIWTTVILGLALLLFMIKLFNGSGGGE